ncbi:sodium:proton antiporter (plasmid) [Deinococcus radiodurans]|jgi:sodium/proton antiporter, CPA1 family (TC 2.A.36)|uniref:Na+/H+ antiporter, putative n=1 Tax=Deinococcus radiodurans (strain ATCC 13939 / DSM 20539 / JCM 16871 / CCUG 27074 / LMG 4051 / NBRC 15346 / NCIMB 9279 / VKM B-1422 / R1) TaxID=243230 RepID=Q9RZK7_DEIRA|nr:Na+/H+ antiporter, putative [Deinococcus radiodurans R1 = ATCC 13939 = DSM 20539]QEM73233.1 sodium:proton antiporter [Deinococcus radiodurans]ANC73244.1 sodium:proton antiporter [Deinococcus radiodurans R1 = ATCC 13939 = DSM 20539]QIP30628.1 sodium:proton antiporter [Deinococcus radiodurans]QIP33508.1 sodium:proton antiporter [Deinococcus radiodurans]
MHLLDLSALLVCVTAALAFLNVRVLHLPAAIGVTVGGLLISLLLVVLTALKVPFAQEAVELVRKIQFDEFVFQGVLSFLLFAGALSVDTHALWRLRGPVTVFALLSTALSTALVGGGTYLLLELVGLPTPLAYCLLFGALISPTDPVAVLGMLKEAHVPSRIETLVAGESLFNDGVGVVAFSVLAGVAASSAAGHGPELSAGGVLRFFLQEAGGGLLLGGFLGWLGFLALKRVDDFVTEVLLTLGVVMACTAIATHLHVSGPLAAVAAGLLMGSLTDWRPGALSSREKFDSFWHLTDELLNISLFSLLALEIVAVKFSASALLAGLIALPLVLLARSVSVVLPAAALSRAHEFEPYTRRLMIWGGLRGAISVALAFTVPAGPQRELFLVMTYVVVVFSIIVQGLTVSRLAAQAASAADPEAS